MNAPATTSGPAARYRWPDHDDLVTELSGTGGPTVALGLLPHANEPLGYVLPPRPADHLGRPARIAEIGPIDPPPADRRFPLPCDLLTFLARGYLQPLPDQAEFAHCPVPRTDGQRRAARFRDAVARLRPDVLVLVHNDPVARGPYLYANEPWPAAERCVRDQARDPRAPRVLPDADWTHRIGDLTYALFPCSRIGVHGTASAGLYIEQVLGVRTLTLELPMFEWGDAEDARQTIHRAMGNWIAAGDPDTAPLVRTARAALGDTRIPMVPAPVTARTLLSVIRGVLTDLEGVPTAPEGVLTDPGVLTAPEGVLTDPEKDRSRPLQKETSFP